MKKSKMFLAGAALLAGLGLSSAAHAELLGLTTNEPIIDTASGGVIAYDAETGLVTITGTPQLLSNSDPFLFGEFVNSSVDDERTLSIQFKVAPDGSLVDGVDGPDLVVIGAVDVDFDGVMDYDGVLLEAEVTQFGFKDGAMAGGDLFDIRLNSVTGALAHLFGSNDLSVSIASELADDFPNAFDGSFATDFVGLAKTSIGSTDPLIIVPTGACKINVETFCSVGNSTQLGSVCYIKKTKSSKHWVPKWYTVHGHQFCKSKYGTHGQTKPVWSNWSSTTPVKFTYVLTNTGEFPIGNLQVIDSFEADVSGVPGVLAVGQSVTLTRTEPLSEELINAVMVSGDSGAEACMAQDNVAVKNKEHKQGCSAKKHGNHSRCNHGHIFSSHHGKWGYGRR